ncbi:7-carboxy-7-deazaguanine synthase [Pseudemcibacter aquimaris]|uniref:7-carboxy-7-deazaguanine synthase n=1 Tax=Pseudemcibacter aquimaris TaxID=2857064 RepID=UPI0020114E2B|nr:7-carboxy-7-deazaguanine synthase [Pseudemcibacter aquimaris]MCC3859737.1 7-carboxy-7-deazaguanine synthase [Pseudemcibacter aquimaris]WDU60131.1 7-carboxy-7-deazaguanine synthase [Pseudemcibacter aquimaris]
MTYSVKEIFYTLQGEGAHTGRPAVFCRFSGCNLWSGLEKDRENAACNFCDTDFVGVNGQNGGKFKTPEELADKVASFWPSGGMPYVVCTGGEPLLQLDVPLIKAFQERGFEVAVETNGTLPAPEELDWVCVSPKDLTQFVQKSGDEIKLVYPQEKITPKDVEDLNYTNFFLQPLDETGKNHVAEVVEYCQNNPKWRLSLQTHKIIGID